MKGVNSPKRANRKSRHIPAVAPTLSPQTFMFAGLIQAMKDNNNPSDPAHTAAFQHSLKHSQLDMLAEIVSERGTELAGMLATMRLVDSTKEIGDICVHLSVLLLTIAERTGNLDIIADEFIARNHPYA